MTTPRANRAVSKPEPASIGLPPKILFVPLDGSGHDAATVGGKAASLDRLVATGFRVPPSAALTSDAYRAFVRSADLETWLVRFARRRSGAELAEAEREEVEAAFLEAPLPTEVSLALEEAWRYAANGRQVAVRSSATAEDMATSSFAGQYLSVLEVDGLGEAEVALKRVWASLWEAGARAYRRRMRIESRRLAMGVVIQQMVPALQSGVCFTLDPTLDGVLRIETVEGLGEQLVSGAATPTVHQLKLPSLRPLDGSTLHPELRRVARIALRIQEESRAPQDVEWSIAEDGVWVLQARPITTIDRRVRKQQGDGFDTEKIAGALYSPTGVGEMLPGVLSPLLWTINGPMVEEGFRKLFAKLGALPEELHGPYSIVARIDGQAALSISAIKESAAKLAGGDGEDIERQYLGRVVSSSETGSKKPGLVARTSSSLRAMKLQKAIESEADTFEQTARSVTSLDVVLPDLLTSELVAYRARLRDLAASGTATQVAVATVAVTTYSALESMLDRWTGAGAEWAQRLTRGAAISSDPVTSAAKRVWDRFKDLPNAEVLLEAITEGEPGTVEQRLEAACTEGSELAAMLRAELERLGSSSVYAGPLWAEQRGYVWSVVMRWLSEPRSDEQAAVSTSAGSDLAELEESAMSSWKWRAKRILTGQVVDMRKRLLHQMIEDTRRLLHRRETMKSALLALGGMERRVILEMGERLYRRGVLQKVKDVNLLSDWELDEAALGRWTPDQEILQIRRDALVHYRSEPALPTLIADGLETVAPTDSLKGWAASPGKHRGRVRIVSDLRQAGDLQHGDVLVASATDPSWTPLFMIAGAIVVERGGPLSHAAIVSRELGVPAVLNAAGATASLMDGALVEVDGSSGTITVIEPEPPLEEAV